MKKVVWGTGYYASRFFITHDIKDIDLFIDSDMKKDGQMFLGKQIIHPSKIENWKELFVYIPFNYFGEISEKLKKKGLKEQDDFTKYMRVQCLSEDEAEKDYQRAVAEIIMQKDKMQGKILFWGLQWWYKCEYKKFLLQMQGNREGARFALVAEEVWLDRVSTEIKAEVPTIIAPKIFNLETYIKGEQVLTNENIYVEQLNGSFSDHINAILMVDYIYKYIYKIIDELKPISIIALSTSTTAHSILREICKKERIPIIFTHPGILPGTFAFDIGGEVGESLPAIYAEKFTALSVSNSEIKEASEVWRYLAASKLNRKFQPQNQCINYINSKRKQGLPIVFYAGQNDICSHMVPYTQNTRKYHSPMFQSSIEAAVYLADLCKRNNWNFVYKPHPMFIQENVKELLPANTIYIETGDINDIVDVSDVVVTILSQTNYVALIRHKPVVMLGYNQTRGKGCTYEAFEKDKIESTIMEALKNGFTKAQQDAFLLHIAQVLKYYLYDDMSERALRFGRTAPYSIEEFYGLERLMKEHEGSL